MGRTILGRFRQGLFLGLALGVAVYLVYAVRSGAADVKHALLGFAPSTAIPLLALSLLNYALRFLRWEWYLRLLHIRVPVGTSASVFLAGLAMTLTPGKVGEFLKSYLLKERCQVPMAVSAPVVFAERISDLLALLLLASLGAARYGGPQAIPLLIGAGASIGGALAVLQSKTLTDACLRLGGRVPLVSRAVPKLRDAVDASRALLGLRALLPALLLSGVAWLAECAEYWIAWDGFGVSGPSLPVAVFGYAFSTVAGVVSPGGLGPTDIGLIEIAARFTPGLAHDVATAAAFVVRLSTLWFAVGIGAVALLRFRTLVDVDAETARAG